MRLGSFNYHSTHAGLRVNKNDQRDRMQDRAYNTKRSMKQTAQLTK